MVSDKEIEAAARAVATADWRFEIDEFREPERWTEAVNAYNLTNNNWRFRYDEIARAALEAAARVKADAGEPVADEKLPCDVQLPGVKLERGVRLSTLLMAIRKRKDWPEEQTKLPRMPVAARPAPQPSESVAKALEQARVVGESYLRFTPDGDAELLDPTTVFLREEPAETLVEQIGALLALNKTGNVSHPIPGLAVELLERAKAALSAPEQSGWQPIETAPKDGTPIITCVAGFEPMVSARWIEYEGKAMFSEDPDTFMKEEHFGEYFHNVSYYPTHWMPLPTPPKAGGDDD